jgi:hypothetical protein
LAAHGRVVVVDSEVPESGWMSVDLSGCIPAAGPTVPGTGWDRAHGPWLAEAAPCGRHRSDIRKPPTKEPLTIARLEAWAERLRGSERPTPNDGFAPAASEPVAAEAPVATESVPEPTPVRSIRPEDFVTVGRRPAEPAIFREPLAAPEQPVAAKPPLARPALKVVAGRSRFSLGGVPSSSGVRFILLCLAAFFLSAGAVHSYGRWKHSRAIVVPVSITPGAVIT